MKKLKLLSMLAALVCATSMWADDHSIALADGVANADKVNLNVASAAEGATITLTPIAGWEITSFRALSLDNEATEAAFSFAAANSSSYNGTYITGWSRYAQAGLGARIGESYNTDVTFTAKDENAVILRVDANANTSYGSPEGTSVSSGNFSYTSSAIHVTNVKAHSLNMQKNSAGNYYISSITVQVATLRELASAKNEATGAYSFEMSDANVMIEATIAPQYAIDLSGIEHVTISQAAAAAGNTVVVTPEAGYKITAFTASHMEDRYNIYIYGDDQKEELNVALPRNVGVYTPNWGDNPIENVHLSGGDGKVSIAGQGYDDVTIRVTDAFSGTATVYYTVRWCEYEGDWGCEEEGSSDESFSVACSATAPGQVNLSSSKNDVTGAYSFTMPAHDVTITATVEVDPDYAPSEFDITANPDPQNGSVYYSTFYHSGADYTLPAGVEAFKAAISGDALNLTKVAEASEAIPAGNAVILKSNNQNYTLTASAATTSSYSENSLQGTNAAINTPSNCYVLSGESSDHSVTGVGFYQYTGAKVGAHKAYIQWVGSGAPRRMRFVFNEENTATAVENANVEGKSVKFIENGQFYILRNGVRYNAQGQIIK